MPRKNPFKHYRFPREIILCAVRMYLRYPLSYSDVRDLLEERGVQIDRATIYRWVINLATGAPRVRATVAKGPEIAQRSFAHRNSKGLGWHVDETYDICGVPSIRTANFLISGLQRGVMLKLQRLFSDRLSKPSVSLGPLAFELINQV